MNSVSRAILPLLLLAGLVPFASCYTQQEEENTLPAPQATAPTLPAAPRPAASAARPAAAPTPVPPPPPQPATVDQWIAQAEQEYARGAANYADGHLEAAKDNFDAAFNLLLRTPMGMQNDERLQAEFDKIVEATHELEMQALKAGDGFTEQHVEPAPIDEANSITFPADPNVKAKAQAELANTRSDLPLMLTDPVVSYINYFSSRGHDVIERALIRRGRYNAMISRIFHEESVPQDLMFLAQAESGFQPHAMSRVGALGMWQFMPWDGEHAGLQRNWWVDERQDPEKSTRAAARLLKDLFNQFGDWYLAMAAYNSGPGTVQRAVQRTGYADFWELYRRNALPQETRNYVPIILAMTIMAKNPSQYGLDHLPADPASASDTVRIHYPIDLRLVAECTDSSTEVLQELNPSLLRMTTPKDMDFDLHLPRGTAAAFEKSVAAIPEEMRVYWRFHRVENGETLSEIARRYHTTSSAISEANNLQSEDLAQDAKLIIPVYPAKAAPVVEGEHGGGVRYSRRPTRYTVHRGDSVDSVADDFGISPDKLRQWNHLHSGQLTAGRSLTIFKPAASDSAGQSEGSVAGGHSQRGREESRPSTHGARRGAHSSGHGTTRREERGGTEGRAAKHTGRVAEGSASSHRKKHPQHG